MKKNLIEKEISATAGNVDTEITVPPDQQWRILYGHISLTTDGTTANRWIRPSIQDTDGNKHVCLCAGAAVTASSTQSTEYMTGIYRETAFINDTMQVPLPTEGWIEGGHKIDIQIENGVAGDEYTARFVVEVK